MAERFDGVAIALLGFVPQGGADRHRIVVDRNIDRRIEEHAEVGKFAAHRVRVVERVRAHAQLHIERATALVGPVGDRAERRRDGHLTLLGDVVAEEVGRRRARAQRREGARQLDFHGVENRTRGIGW